MKKLISLSILLLLCIPHISYAEKGDIEIKFDTQSCQNIKYTCDTDKNDTKRYGWSYYSNDRGCGCTQILSNSKIQTLEKKIDSLIIAINTVFPEEKARNNLLKRIKSHLISKYRNTITNNLYTEIILSKLYNAYGDF